MQQLYILNPNYLLRHDRKRSYIISRPIGKDLSLYSDEWVHMIHPIQAMILSFFSKPKILKQAISDIATFLDMDFEAVKELIMPYIENDEPIYAEYDNVIFPFPKNVIIKSDRSVQRITKYKPQDFIYSDLDFKTPRYYTVPLNITIMLNNNCITDCIYCYADTRNPMHCKMSYEKLEEIVKEANQKSIMSVSLIGGEVFNHPEWYEVFKLLEKYRYSIDFISTKMPLSEEDVEKLKEFKSIKIQISLDSVDEEELSTILSIGKGYIEKIKKTIGLFEKHGISYQIATVCTKINGHKDSLRKTFEYLNTKQLIDHWDVRIAFRSLYSKDDFLKYKLTEEEAMGVVNFVEELQRKSEITIRNDDIFQNKLSHQAKEGTKSFYGARCSSNHSHMFILPDGNVTFCEQLYWKERFFIGNVNYQTLEEVWNSEVSLKWSHLERSDFRDESPCKSCELFEECYHNYTNKCMPDVIKAYGEENWDYPDPRCIKSPPLINSLY